MAANSEMETDDHNHLPPSTGLRRSNSAPNISAAAINDSLKTFTLNPQPRQRRFSVNSSNQNQTSAKPVAVGSPVSRVYQLIRDESVDDVRHENDFLSSSRLITDLDENMSLAGHERHTHDTPMHERRDSFEGPDMFPSPAPSSPSPTRFSRQIPRSARSLTPSPIPSPTRPTVTLRRSISPVCLRPSSLPPSLKRPTHGFELGVSPSKRVCDSSSQSTSPEAPCETAHLDFDNINSIQMDTKYSLALTNTSSTTLLSSPMLFGEPSRINFPSYRSRFTPPRSPLAGPVTSHSVHTEASVSIGNTPACFTFAPVRE
ncbi:P2R1A-PPP2R2A-interacting phosphatase regulator 1 isoform X2 [Nematostella vectensis]|uniref:P2R1A-PPP2R2A-interacting phosphatase regulator 1 isoform X2 n=1 Tax=Nematostella vectensis TaxID=45351 RepID=UPI0013902491|nr:P2R1A-PPP2R2A-interacting phosphatase regulator 1 isoform X2 [Nematostella vectensis]